MELTQTPTHPDAAVGASRGGADLTPTIAAVPFFSFCFHGVGHFAELWAERRAHNDAVAGGLRHLLQRRLPRCPSARAESCPDDAVAGGLRTAARRRTVRWRTTAVIEPASAAIGDGEEAAGSKATRRCLRQKGLPFLFRNNASIPAMLTLLALIYGYNAFSDWTAEPEMPDEEKGQALAGGRVLMDDGSIVRRTGPGR